MKTTSLTIALAILAGFCARKSHAVEASVELPEAAIKAFLQEQGIPEINPRPNAPLQRDFDVKWAGWFQRAVIEPFAARLKVDDATRSRAISLAQQGILHVRKLSQRDPAFTAEQMAGECEALVKAGVDDPLIYWMQSWAIQESTRDFPSSQAAFDKGFKNKKFKEMPPAQRGLMIVGFKLITQDASRPSSFKGFEKGLIAALRESLEVPTYTADEDEIFFTNFNRAVNEEVFKSDVPGVLAICEAPGLSDWTRNMLMATYHSRRAWLDRGHEFANAVKPEGWKGFDEHRAISIDLYMKAWKSHPERVEAPDRIFAIGMTGGTIPDTTSAWFDRTLDACFDFMPAYRATLNGLRPRWGGSVPKMIAFALACAETRRFDTEVPYFFFEMLGDVVRETDDWQAVLRDGLVSQVTIALCQQRVKDAKTPEMKEIALSLLGAYGWLCGEYKTAADALAKVPPGFRRPVIVELFPFIGINEAQIRGESIIYAAGFEQLWASAEQAWLDRDYTTAGKAYEMVRTQTDGAGAALATGRLAVLRFEQEFAKGGWTSLKIDPSLAGWRIQKGDWTGTAEGHLINRGKGTSAFIYHLGRIGAEFQIRGEYETNGDGVGVAVGFEQLPEQHRETWVTCFQMGGANGSDVYLTDMYNKSSIGEVKIQDSALESTFLITCHAGKITYAINDHEVFREAEPHDTSDRKRPLKPSPDSHVGFGHVLFDNGKETKIKKAEVRLLPQGFALDPPPPPPPGPDAESQKLLASEGPWSGEIKLGKGFYKPEHKIEIGAPDPTDAKKIIAGKVTSPSGVQFEGGNIFLKKDCAWKAERNLFKGTDLSLELHAKFEARDSLFERCSLHKGGAWFVSLFSSKWTFESCVFSKSFIKPWKLVDIGVKAANCTFYDVDFPPIQFKEDAGKEALNEWVALKNCRFIRCKVSESVLLTCRDCVFEDCQFGDAEKNLKIKTPIKVVIYSSGQKNPPAAGQDRTIEVADAKTAPHPAGATVRHRYENNRLKLE